MTKYLKYLMLLLTINFTKQTNLTYPVNQTNLTYPVNQTN